MKKPSLLEKEVPHFIDKEIIAEVKAGKHQDLVFRFPPEPNGYLHIGHAKALCLNFGYARDNENAVCNLRFDDTNPEKESDEYVRAIQEDINWLGFSFKNRLFFGSDYFEQLYKWAIELIEKGLAYVDESTQEQMRKQRGSLTEVGSNSPYRDRSVDENLLLFKEMYEGKHPDGSMILRAKIDMTHPNMNMRDPAIYRIRHIHHHRTEDKWCIYPMYDFQHPLSDSIEGVTHSLCSLEYEDHRPLYNWFVDNVSTPSKPRQIEFARLNLNYLVMSKRKLIQLVEEQHVDGWSDPRMPTLSGMRRRGITPKAIIDFMDFTSVGKKYTIIDYSVFEKFVRDDLNEITRRAMGVLEPLKVTITNWDEDVEIDAPFHPKDDSFGSRKLKLAKTIYIEQSDFLKDPPSPKKWFRLGPDRRARLRYGCIIHCDEFIEDADGNVIELKCHYIKDSFNGKTPEGEKKAKGIIHWVNADQAVDVEVRLYDRLFKVENPDGDKETNFLEHLNSESLKTLTAKVEPYIASLNAGERVQFERMGYFIADTKYSSPEAPVFNRTATLKDTWAKIEAKGNH